jgi:hypothetical protein
MVMTSAEDRYRYDACLYRKLDSAIIVMKSASADRAKLETRGARMLPNRLLVARLIMQDKTPAAIERGGPALIRCRGRLAAAPPFHNPSSNIG